MSKDFFQFSDVNFFSKKLNVRNNAKKKSNMITKFRIRILWRVNISLPIIEGLE
jgi:hypothetical protein